MSHKSALSSCDNAHSICHTVDDLAESDCTSYMLSDRMLYMDVTAHPICHTFVIYLDVTAPPICHVFVLYLDATAPPLEEGKLAYQLKF